MQQDICLCKEGLLVKGYEKALGYVRGLGAGSENYFCVRGHIEQNGGRWKGCLGNVFRILLS